ncbi:DUF11 domain-containing protein [Nocardioides panaciterrulae]|uniref:Putative repeat protein (TIGR01451 family) n=1 Tax=Nocardioides panaciterrulae TaxID=661492 RepID=A0A7Y9E5E9_9ACTN|nr:DUF11 domain-containing protein [Nocardioides panaciterrulae]NYD41414.1 putative repeat protein (TIGR01451 family) [Nocardioides panaciterrulae]
MHNIRRTLGAITAGTAGLAMTLSAGLATTAYAGPAPGDDAPIKLTPKGEIAAEFHGADEADAGVEKLRDAYYWSRLLSGDEPIDLSQAARLRLKAANRTDAMRASTARRDAHGAGGGGTWVNQGPDPIVQVVRTTNSFAAMSGRVGALAIRKDGTILVGGAQGGVWSYDSSEGPDGTWTPRTQDTDTQSVGALAVAPSKDRVVYMGSGEGSLAGDSYYGDGIYRSKNGGMSWQHVSSKFTGQAVTDIAVDPHHANVLYASTVRGRGGSHRTSAPTEVKYGVWGSRNGGRTWTLLKGTKNQLHGATDLVIDPQNPKVLWASFWGKGIYRSTNSGHSWKSAMGDLPDGKFNAGGTRFSLGLSHPASDAQATVYVGFDYYDSKANYHPAQIWKTTDDGAHWASAVGSTTGDDSVVDYCGTQCFYDNEVKPDPTNPDVLYVEGSYGYNNSPPSGGIYRSTDGGQTWKNLGLDLHPDFHAIAFDPANTDHIAIGNDGGVWQSFHQGGRTNDGETLADTDWQDLNGTVDPNTGALIHSTNLSIGQYVSMQTVPQVEGQYWGGLQDNGTLRKSTVNDRWFDQASGDGGYAQVDQSTVNPNAPTALPAYVFGEYYAISPYRYDPTETGTIFGNEMIDGGINPKDRSEFYVPMTLNQGNTNQMFLGTYRLYRTDNAETESAADVTWKPISGDLTSGCEQTASNGARGCVISSVGVSDGGTGVYVGTDEGWIQVSPDATTSDDPSWTRVGTDVLPGRPVDQIAVDRSNWRIAYAGFAGFDKATPDTPGHLFATTDGGKHWKNVTANLPDVPVDTVVIDPSNNKTVYVGTDVGPFISTNAGRSWTRLGTMPKVAVWQMDYDASHGILAAGTHGRGAYTMKNRGPLPALLVSKSEATENIGPGKTIHYTITVKNIGNQDATGVTVTDPLPAYTRSANIGQGGHFDTDGARWDGVTVPAGDKVALTFSVRVVDNLPASVEQIINDGITVTSAQGPGATGSPFVTPIAPKHAVSISPDQDTQGAKAGDRTTFTETLTNDGYEADSYALSVSGNQWPATVYADDCTTPLATTDPVASGDSTDVCVKVDVPAGAANDATDTATLKATSVADSSVSDTADLTSIAVTVDTLVVDEDTNDPVDSRPYYTDALDANNIDYSVWDLGDKPQLPESYLTAHSKVVWFTGNSYPAPIGSYEHELKAFLDNGGSLFLSGQDLLDQAAGTTDFVHDYLHVDWDGSEAQNDKATKAVHGVTGNPVTDGIGAVPLDHSVLQANYEDEITPIGGAEAAFTDDSTNPDALSFAGDYKVVFAAFPFEAYGTSSDKSDLMKRVFGFFG